MGVLFMSIGKRIKKVRNMRGMTLKELGVAVGFDENSADVRIAQYESGTRTPKEENMKKIANALNVSPKTLECPDIYNLEGLAHTLFMLEDIYGLKVEIVNGNFYLTPDKSKYRFYFPLLSIFSAWQTETNKLYNGKITENEYNTWRYNFRLQRKEKNLDHTDILTVDIEKMIREYSLYGKDAKPDFDKLNVTEIARIKDLL
jgi:transcriptional regulator with XRE-family HTH domain